ncbi:hypothetical protein LARI1_G004175 [Lachnellula arida]|uniref:Uncharacterized protein n=1 Tax=Lachnellula arida TaxID=1316785 RepID=A0A8T9BHI2_9HELO|nr:hypothetical protein LARI1_G004175 [Lachnellula arida]
MPPKFSVMKATAPQVYGIQELYRAADAPAEIDIVAVHGLNGDSIKTWTSEPEGICWLSHPDFLPKYVNRARVLTWGYNANVSSLDGRTTSSDRIYGMLKHLWHNYMLIESLKVPNTDRSSFFVTPWVCTPAHTPFSSSALHTTAPTKHVSLPSSKTRDSPKHYRLIRASDVQLLHLLFLGIGENRPGECIVDEASAAPVLDDTERSGVAGDYRGMCRFKKHTSQDFRTVVAALRRYSQQAPRVIRGRLLEAESLDRDRRGEEAMKLLRYGRFPMGANLIESSSSRDC